MTDRLPDLKILIVAPNVSSRFGGESMLPLMYFSILHKRGFPVRLVTHSRNRDDLATLFPDDQTAIDYVEDHAMYRWLGRVGQWLPAALRHVIVGSLINLMHERFQNRLIAKRVAEGLVDVIHQPAPVSPKLPSSVHGFGVPVVIGPMNGGMIYPAGYGDHQSASARRFISVTRKLAVALNYIVPGKRKAAALLVANRRTRDALPVRHPNVIELVENAVNLDLWSADVLARPARQPTDPLRLVFLGRLVDWKAVDITLEALALARSQGHDIQLDVLGDGDDRTALEHKAAELALGAVVRFRGFQPQAACARLMQSADALILNSLYECGGAVVLEAMSLGLPVIASNWGGPADYLDESCGILVSPVPRQDFAERLADAIIRLAGDPELSRQMGVAGRKKVENEYDWQKKVDTMVEVYRNALGLAKLPEHAAKAPSAATG